MNKVIIKGNLTREPELKDVGGDKFVAEFGVAVNRRVKEGEEWVDMPEFMEMKCWANRGEAICNHFGKGDPILVEGEFRTDRWEDADGVKKSKSFIHVNDFEFCARKEK